MKIKKHILPLIGTICYEKLTADALNTFVLDSLSVGHSAKYVSDISILIKSMCKFAYHQYGYADKTVFMVLPKREKINLPQINFHSLRHMFEKKRVTRN